MENIKNLIKSALGEIEPDLILKGGKVYDVFSGNVIWADVAIKDGIICGVGKYSGVNETDVSGKYIIPGFCDSHLHIESSMLTPAEYARLVMPHGVTTVLADPHEIANVCGEDGMNFMKESAKSVPLDILFMLPSCVPCAPFDHSGATLSAKDTIRLSDEFYGIAEMMNYPGVLGCDDEVLGKLIKNKIIDGHAPLLSGNSLDAYISAGIKTDHECSNPEELQEKISKGMYVLLREGTLSKDIERLAPGVTTKNSHRCLFCTDDRFAGEIKKEGSIDFCIKKAVDNGINITDAINMATINAAICYNLNCGAVAPSYNADLVICDDLIPEKIRMVYKNGVLVAKDGIALFEGSLCDTKKVSDTVHLKTTDAKFFEYETKDSFPAIELIPDAIITKKVIADKSMPLSKVCVIERHHMTGHKGFAYVTNYGIKNGAIASSIGHDSHNVIVIGDNDPDMALAVNTLGKTGGFAVCQNGKVLEYLPLEIAGIMSTKPADEVIKTHDRLHDAAKELNVTNGVDPFLSLAFLPLPVIPQIRVTDSGLFDVTEFKFI